MVSRAAVLLATFALVAGCGSEDGGGDGGGKDDDPLAMLAQAARKSSQTESFRYNAKMDSDIGSETMKIDATDGSMYMSGEDLGLPAGKWVKMEDSPTNTMSPSEVVKFLQDSGDVELVGTETIRGEEGQHFRGPLNMKELIEKEAGSAFLEQMKDTPGVEELEVVIDILVPDSGLPSRMAVAMTMPGQEGSLKMTSDVLEYDVPVNADPPPDDKVVESPGG
jgi:hypothetical protein